MAYSYVKYTADGDNAVFAVTFPYLDRDHVRVYLDDADAPLADTQYDWLTDQSLRILSVPDAGVVVTLRRKTPVSKKLVEFSTGYILASDLNESGTQLLYIVQEAIEADYVGSAAQTVLDAADRAIDAASDASESDQHATQVASALIAPYHIGFSFSSEIGSGENVGAWVCPLGFDVSFPAGLDKSASYAAVPPASAATFSIQRNNQEIGTVTFSPDGNVGTAESMAGSFAVTGGDRLRVISPSPKDPNLADVSITLAGQRIPWEV